MGQTLPPIGGVRIGDEFFFVSLQGLQGSYVSILMAPGLWQPKWLRAADFLHNLPDISQYKQKDDCRFCPSRNPDNP